MLKFHRQDVPDTAKYEEHLNESKFIYFKSDAVKATLPYLTAKEQTMLELSVLEIRANSGNNYLGVGDQNVYEYLTTEEHVPPRKLGTSKTKRGFSLNADSKLKPLYEAGYAQEFLSVFLEYKNAKTMNSKMSSIVNMSTTPIAKANDGSNLYPLYYNVKQDSNLRYNYSDYNIVTIPKAYNSSISVPEGYILVWGDFEQADFRNAYNLLLRNKEYAEVVEACPDRYEGMARLIALTNNEEFDLIKFKEERALYKELTLATMYGQIKPKTNEAIAFTNRLRDFLNKCPKYKEFKDTLELYANLDSQIYVDSYFGHTETKAVGYDKTDAVNFCLNSPIQACTSEIMILTVNKILDKFYDLGYTKDDIHLYFARHDEPLFIMKADVMKDAWVFKDCSEIIVDDWSPLQMTFKYGYDYKVEDKVLTDRAEKNYKLNEDRITIVTADEESNGDYFPLTRILKLGAGIYSSPVSNKNMICLFDEKSNTAKYFMCECDRNDKETLGNSIQQIVNSLSEEYYEKGYGNVLVNNMVTQGELYENRVFMRFKIETSQMYNKAAILAQVKFGIEFPDEVNAKEMASLININKYWLKPLGVI